MIKTLKPHQQKAVEDLENGKILWGRPGSGKSLVAIAYFVSKVCGGAYGDFGSMRTPKDIYIITTAKKRDSLDWEKEAQNFGITNWRDGSVAGIQLKVDSWNNVERYLDVKDAFFIFDEQRVVGAGAWSQTFIKIAKKNEWILLSGTPGDTWLDYIPVFVANGWYKNRTDFKRKHVIYNAFTKFPKVDRYVNVGKLVKLKNHILVHMPFESHTVWHTKDIPVTYDKKQYERVYYDRWHVYENRPIRDVSELFAVMRRVVNTDSSRLTGVRTLLESNPRMIVFYNFDYELEMLRTLSESSSETSPMSEKTSSFAVAEWNGHKHEPIPTTERWVYLVQYAAGAEGWNCVTTNAVCFYSLTYSYKLFRQAYGRIDRMDTPFVDLWYLILMDDSMISQAIRKSLKQKRSFNEAKSGLV